MNGKKWYSSKTLWANMVALGAIGVQAAMGETVMDPAWQAAILAVSNAALRMTTNQPLR
ncbi:MAG: hypothetical protein ACLGSA_12245 [Acidobacteriota bacterium]